MEETIAAGETTGPTRANARRAHIDGPPERIGRHVILRRLGAGGMGVVFLAYDPELDRRLAIKVIRGSTASTMGSAGTEAERARVTREARALAKLSHPNVIQVYDVGEHAGDVFIAMEYVDGQTLGSWVRSRTGSRTWSEIVDAYVRAGRGLAAAHARGLVHRDFKPENVLVGNDGRVRVLDFGLARSLDDGASPREQVDATADVEEPFVSRAGAVMGTPAYMAPEQWAALETDARTDQFSFGVALIEALYGRRPFDDRSAAALAAAVMDGDVRPLPRDGDVPSWVRDICLRTISREPEDRFPSMDALLDALRNDPRIRRNQLLVGGVGVLGVAALVAVAAQGRAGPEAKDAPCKDVAAAIDPVWNEASRTRLEAGFERSGAPTASAAWKQTSGVLELYASEWRTARTDACEATHVRSEQSESLMDLRMACLDTRLAELDAALAALEAPDAKTARNASANVRKLSSIASCAQRDYLAASVKPPTDPELAARVADIDEALARIRGRELVGGWESAMADAEATLNLARETDYAPVIARAQFRRGRLRQVSGKNEEAAEDLEASYFDLYASGQDFLALDAAASLVFTHGIRLADHEMGLHWGRIAEAALRRSGDEPAREAQLHANLGGIRYRQGKYEDARAEFERARDVLIPSQGENSYDSYPAHSGLGNVAAAQGEHDDAIAHYGKAVAIVEREFGDDSPRLVGQLSNLANVLVSKGEFDEAEAMYRRGMEIAASSLGPDHVDGATPVANLAWLMGKQGRTDDAETYHRRALDLLEKNLPEDHPKLIEPLNSLGLIAERRGDFGDALELYDRCVGIALGSLGKDHRRMAGLLSNRGEAKRRSGDLEGAREDNARALEIRTNVLGPDHVRLTYPLANRGRIELDERRFADAEATYARVLTLRTADGKTPSGDDLGEARFGLARARWKLGKDKAGARALAETAMADYRSAGPRWHFRVEEIERWLATR